MRYLILFALFTFTVDTFAQNFVVLPESEVSFSVANLKVNTVSGSFGDLRGAGSFDPGQPEGSNFEVSVGASTVDTGIGKRDRHLMEKEFFNVEEYPRITVKSRDVMHSAVEGRYQFSGELTIKDISKTFECAFFLKKEGGYTVLEGSFTIMRSDFQLGDSYGTFVIGEEVDVQVKLICDVR